MINILKKENINIGILETDFDIFSDITNTFTDDKLKSECLVDLDDYVLPDYFKNKITIVMQTNETLIGYTIFEFINKNNTSEALINKTFILDQFKNKNMESLLIESVIYVSGEVGARNVISKITEDDYLYDIYTNIGFYEIGMYENGNILSANVNTTITTRNLNEKFRDIQKDAINYKDLKLIKKIAQGRSGILYLTSDNRILKMFKSTSFTYIKDREEALRYIKTLNLDEIIKPKNLVYYDGIFVGYIMDYLPDGTPFIEKSKDYDFEEKIEKLKKLEKVMKKLHENKVYICDISLDNLFIDKNGNIKLIDCDSFITKKNVVNSSVYKKYQDPVYKFVCEKTDMYAFGVTALEFLIDEKIDNNASFNDVEKIYNKYKSKIPVSFKYYFDTLFKSKERYYLSDSYEKYINNIYNSDIEEDIDNKSGNISVIILSVILFVIAVLGYLVFKFKING